MAKYFEKIFKYNHSVSFSVGKWISSLDYFGSSTTITRYGFSKQPNAPVDDSSSVGSEPLQFTGNWFIDAGILGFVNLMEEVYGEIWISDENQDFLQILINTLSEIPTSRYETTIENLFSYAFWYKNIRDTTLRWIAKDNFKKKHLKDKYGLEADYLSKIIENAIIKELDKWNRENAKTVLNLPREDVYKKIIELNEFIKTLLKEYYGKYQDSLKKVYASNKKTLVENLESIGFVAYNSFFTNLSFFNPASNRKGKEEKILELFKNFINNYFVRKDKKVKALPFDLLDKSLSPFIYSASDFNNQLYSMPMTLRNLEQVCVINPTYFILSFPYSFIWVQGKYYMFYSPSLGLSYAVNKQLKLMLMDIKENKNVMTSIFKVTWRAILDKLNEYRSASYLENLYVIEYSDIQNQQIQNVEYIGISKLKATFLLDDIFRDALNKSIPTPWKDNNGRRIWIWLLEEFIKDKPLFPQLTNYTQGLIADTWTSNERKIGFSTLITALAVDAKIKEMKSSNVYDKGLFNESYFSKYKDIVGETKQQISKIYYYGRLLYDIVEDSNERKKLANLLFRKIKSHHKYGFVNDALRYITGKIDNGEAKNIVRYLFEYILNNDTSWENYALALVISLIKRGDESG